MRTLTCALSLMICGMVLAEKPATAPSTQPSTRPTTLPAERKALINKLVVQLGDDDPRIRQQASDELRKIGKDALPALAKAKDSDDLEVSTRSQAITRQIEDDLKPKVASKPDPFVEGPNGVRIFRGGQGGVQIHVQGGIAIAGGGNGVMRVQMVQAGDGVKDISVTENDRTVKIHEDKDGITVSVTEPDKDGKKETKEYKAKDVDTLKKEHPEAHKLYEKYSGQGGAIQIQGFQLQGMQGGVIEGNEDVEKVRERAAERRREMQKQVEEARKLAEQARRQAEEARRQADEEQKK